jgi:hypothetical protein
VNEAKTLAVVAKRGSEADRRDTDLGAIHGQLRANLQRLQMGSGSSNHAIVVPPQRAQVAETSCAAGRTFGSSRSFLGQDLRSCVQRR